MKKTPGYYRAVLFVACAQSNLWGLAFGYWCAKHSPDATPGYLTLAALAYLAASWYV